MTIPFEGADRLRLVLFDLDGTLVDSAPDIAASVNQLLDRHGLAAHPLDRVRGMIGHGVEKLVERAFAAHGVVLDGDGLAERHAQMMDIYARNLTTLTTLNPGAAEAVHAARRMGLRLGVITNKPEGFSRTILDHFDLLDAFETVLGGDSGPARKPAPDLVLAACAAAGCSPAEAVLVGDSAADVKAAKAAGAWVIVVRGGYTDIAAEDLGADLVIDDFHALPMLLAPARLTA